MNWTAIFSDPWTYLALYLLFIFVVGMPMARIILRNEPKPKKPNTPESYTGYHWGVLALMVFSPLLMVLFTAAGIVWVLWKCILCPTSEMALPKHLRYPTKEKKE